MAFRGISYGLSAEVASKVKCVPKFRLFRQAPVYSPSILNDPSGSRTAKWKLDPRMSSRFLVSPNTGEIIPDWTLHKFSLVLGSEWGTRGERISPAARSILALGHQRTLGSQAWGFCVQLFPRLASVTKRPLACWDTGVSLSRYSRLVRLHSFTWKSSGRQVGAEINAAPTQKFRRMRLHRRGGGGERGEELPGAPDWIWIRSVFTGIQD